MMWLSLDLFRRLIVIYRPKGRPKIIKMYMNVANINLPWDWELSILTPDRLEPIIPMPHLKNIGKNPPPNIPRRKCWECHHRMWGGWWLNCSGKKQKSCSWRRKFSSIEHTQGKVVLTLCYAPLESDIINLIHTLILWIYYATIPLNRWSIYSLLRRHSWKFTLIKGVHLHRSVLNLNITRL